MDLELKTKLKSIEIVYDLKAIRTNKKDCNKVLNFSKTENFLFVKQNVNCVRIDPSSKQHRILLLSLESIPTADYHLQRVMELIKCDFKRESDVPTLMDYSLRLGYSELNTQEVLKEMIPSDFLPQSAFQTIGHIAHFNIREELKPYRHIIGQIILDKNKHIRTVVNKIETIDSEFRTLEMEVIAGESDFIATVRENDCLFKLDYKSVFWNSRLGEEHNRVVSKLHSNDYLIDLFCGIGPFAIPAAKKGVKVWANDLNPISCDYLTKNVKLNKISTLSISNLDAKLFFNSIVLPLLQTLNSDSPQKTESINFVMNLPKSAMDFLDLFDGLPFENSFYSRLKVFCYSFFDFHQTDSQIIKKVKEKLTGNTLELACCIIRVRKISPKKEMVCIEIEFKNK